MKINLDDLFPEAASGIKIRPENRGKFTAYKKRTGKTTEEALHSKDPHVRQMANFARNSAKWHHGEAGLEMPLPVSYYSQINNDPHSVQPWQDLQPYHSFNELDTSKAIPGGVPQYQQITPNTQSPQSIPQQDNQSSNKGFNYHGQAGDAITGLLSIIDSRLKNPDLKFRPTPSNVSYNPYPQGTGSQALYEAGGGLTADKAKEILRDGTAQGHKLTAKQKRYFGFIAGGGQPKAEAGMSFEGDFYPPSSQTYKRYEGFAKEMGKKATGGGIINTTYPYTYAQGGDPVPPGDTTHLNKANGYINPAQNRSRFQDRTAETLSYLASQGVNPRGLKGGSSLISSASEAYDPNVAHNLYNSLVTFSSRDDIKGMSPQQRVDAYYRLNQNNPAISQYTNNLKLIGYDPYSNAMSSPDQSLYSEALQPLVQQPSPVAKKKAGGKMKYKR